jgi:hypothetical protein
MQLKNIIILMCFYTFLSSNMLQAATISRTEALNVYQTTATHFYEVNGQTTAELLKNLEILRQIVKDFKFKDALSLNNPAVIERLLIASDAYELKNAYENGKRVSAFFKDFNWEEEKALAISNRDIEVFLKVPELKDQFIEIILSAQKELSIFGRLYFVAKKNKNLPVLLIFSHAMPFPRHLKLSGDFYKDAYKYLERNQISLSLRSREFFTQLILDLAAPMANTRQKAISELRFLKTENIENQLQILKAYENEINTHLRELYLDVLKDFPIKIELVYNHLLQIISKQNQGHEPNRFRGHDEFVLALIYSKNNPDWRAKLIKTIALNEHRFQRRDGFNPIINFLIQELKSQSLVVKESALMSIDLLKIQDYKIIHALTSVLENNLEDEKVRTLVFVILFNVLKREVEFSKDPRFLHAPDNLELILSAREALEYFLFNYKLINRGQNAIKLSDRNIEITTTDLSHLHFDLEKYFFNHSSKNCETTIKLLL